MAKGASFITNSVTLSMIEAACSTRFRTAGALSSSAATAVPTNREKTTICRISLRAMASKIDVGTRWVMKPCSEKASVEAAGAAAITASGRCMPAPGCRSCTMVRPSSRETIEAPMNQVMVLTPIRPTEAASSMWAMPATRVVKTSGAMIILISRRKTSVTRLRLEAAAEAWSALRKWLRPHPVRTPKIIAPTMK
ncbi:hypothetical protein D3C77_478600 [compost metagenome]